MTRIQILIVALSLVGSVMCAAKLRSALLKRMVVLAHAVMVAVLMICPRTATSLAQALGVGRGIDVTFCAALLGELSILVLLFSNICALERKLVDVARAVALLGAERGSIPSGSVAVEAQDQR